ncbi:MAG TPA: YgiQ family radical SAM protein [Bacteroidales bacterium]|nr:MAG: YgiQ family radical SAM protein [Bacteroidetes bacterium GWF2_33_38]HBF88081.1 YgiQ family radical SAM protein [Bacteroidales bacterium]
MQQERNISLTKWLPTTLKEVKLRGWSEGELDVILFTGDAYVDHPSFGAAVIGRILENEGLKVAIVPQPNWQDDLRDFKKLGKPKLFFGVTSGNMDSMVNHYTANKRLRSNDAYTVGGKAGFRPDYATKVYSNILKNIFPEIPVIIGGIEASLRRFTHYDYWSDKLNPSILIDSKADLLLYGMSEQAIVEVVQNLKTGEKISELKNIPQTAFIERLGNKHENAIVLHRHEDCLASKTKYAENFKHIEIESNKLEARTIVQEVNNKMLVVNPPYPPMNETEFDKIFELPYTRLPHPKYDKKGDIPAYEMIKFSINIHRGCFGGCSFCTISAHQGKFIVNRSKKSIVNEIDKISVLPDFKGYLSDLGGPSANMYQMRGVNLEICKTCTKASCIFPNICKNLNTNHASLIDLYRTVRNHKKIKKAFIGSGIRYDIFMKDTTHKANVEYLEELVVHHVSGRLKVAPEHVSDKTLNVMRKPSFQLFRDLNQRFIEICKKHALNQQLIPYFISSHPESTIEEMAKLAIETKQLKFRLEQVQDFTPTPMTLATVMYYSGINPYTNEKVFVAKTKEAKEAQRIFFFWYEKENWNKIKDELKRTRQTHLITVLFGKK